MDSETRKALNDLNASLTRMDQLVKHLNRQLAAIGRDPETILGAAASQDVDEAAPGYAPGISRIERDCASLPGV